MFNYGCRILLKHNEAYDIFKSANYPDITNLRLRDSFLSKIREKLSNITEGTELIETIPDIDISSLLNVGKSYSPSDVFFNSGSIDIGSIATTSAPHSNYFIGLDTTISAA